MIILLTFDNREECDKFIFLYNKYLKTVNYTISLYIKDSYIVEDLSQDVFIIISKNLEKCDLDNLKQTRNYIITIARNYTKNYLRNRSKVQEESLEGVQDYNQLANKFNVLDFIIQKDFQRQLIKEIGNLPDIYREALELKYVTQFSNDEIAQILHIKKKTIEMRLYRANQLLKSRLKDWMNENNI